MQIPMPTPQLDPKLAAYQKAHAQRVALARLDVNAFIELVMKDERTPVFPLQPDPDLLQAAQWLGTRADFLVITANGPHILQAQIEQAAGRKVKIYYTVRELTTHLPELWALRSLGDEVLADGPGGGVGDVGVVEGVADGGACAAASNTEPDSDFPSGNPDCTVVRAGRGG